MIEQFQSGFQRSKLIEKLLGSKQANNNDLVISRSFCLISAFFSKYHFWTNFVQEVHQLI